MGNGAGNIDLGAPQTAGLTCRKGIIGGFGWLGVVVVVVVVALNGRRGHLARDEAIGGEDMRWLRFAELNLVSVKWDSKHAADLYNKGVPLALSPNHKHFLSFSL